MIDLLHKRINVFGSTLAEKKAVRDVIVQQGLCIDSAIRGEVSNAFDNDVVYWCPNRNYLAFSSYQGASIDIHWTEIIDTSNPFYRKVTLP